MNSKLKINLACGDVFVVGHDWLNFDYGPSSTDVQQANLLNRLPIDDGAADLVYSSHFLEHIPRSQVSGFLAECFRILKPGGTLRLVLPDIENLCRAYLEHRSNNEHDKANFVVIEMIDQCVRQESGGELGCYYKKLKSSSNEMTQSIEFVRERTGENLLDNTTVASISSLGGGCVTSCEKHAVALSELGCGLYCHFYLPPFEHKTLAWLVLVNDTSGFGISNSYGQCLKIRASNSLCVAKRTKAVSRASRSTRWILTKRVNLAKAPNRCISRLVNLNNPYNINVLSQPLLERLA